MRMVKIQCFGKLDIGIVKRPVNEVRSRHVVNHLRRLFPELKYVAPDRLLISFDLWIMAGDESSTSFLDIVKRELNDNETL